MAAGCAGFIFPPGDRLCLTRRSITYMRGLIVDIIYVGVN